MDAVQGFRRSHAFALGFAVAAIAPLLTASAAMGQFHGLGVAKQCISRTPVFGPYTCAYRVINNEDDTVPQQNTYTFNSVIDAVHAKRGDVTSANLISTIRWVATNGATCSGGSGTGTLMDPYVGVSSCTLPGTAAILGPFATVESLGNSFYTVQPTDYNNARHLLTDTATVNWTDTTISLRGQDQGVATTAVTQNPSETSTTINPGSPVEAPASVSDTVTVTGVSGKPAPTGPVRVDFFTNNTCSGTAADSTTSTLSGGQATDVLREGPLQAGLYGYEAHYLGDPSNPAYAPSDGTCEPLRVIDANTSLSPATATNPVGRSHTVTCTINVNDGSGFVGASGATCSISVTAGPNTGTKGTCSTNASGQCSFSYTSNGTAGTDTIHASTDVTVAGLSLHRETGDSHASDGKNVSKTWVKAPTPPKPHRHQKPRCVKIAISRVHASIGPQGLLKGNAVLHVSAPASVTRVRVVIYSNGRAYARVFHAHRFTARFDVTNKTIWGTNPHCGCTYDAHVRIVVQFFGTCSHIERDLRYNNQDPRRPPHR
jgi:hypothetical protein